MDEQYDILEELSSSESATVYRGIRKLDGQPVILKVFATTTITTDKICTDMIGTAPPTEYFLLKELQHINGCVQLLDFIDESQNNKWVLVLEDLESAGFVNLAKVITCRSVPLDEGVVSWIIKNLVCVLSEVHAVGVLHCDVKPDNIFVDFKRSLIKLIDFNFSSSARCTPKNLTPPCTPDYAPPEVLVKQDPWTVAGEVWSIGCTAFVLLCKHFPFLNPWMSAYMSPAYPQCTFEIATKIGGSDISLSYRNMTCKPKCRLPTRETTLSPRAKVFLLFCLARLPEDRPNLSALLQHPFLIKNNNELPDVPDIDEVLLARPILVL